MSKISQNRRMPKPLRLPRLFSAYYLERSPFFWKRMAQRASCSGNSGDAGRANPSEPDVAKPFRISSIAHMAAEANPTHLSCLFSLGREKKRPISGKRNVSRLRRLSVVSYRLSDLGCRLSARTQRHRPLETGSPCGNRSRR